MNEIYAQQELNGIIVIGGTMLLIMFYQFNKEL